MAPASVRTRAQPLRGVAVVRGVADQVGVQADDAELLQDLVRHHRRHLADRGQALAMRQLALERLEPAVLLLDA